MLKLLIVGSASGLVSRSPIGMDGKKISLIPWYYGFHAVDFDTQ